MATKPPTMQRRGQSTPLAPVVRITRSTDQDKMAEALGLPGSLAPSPVAAAPASNGFAAAAQALDASGYVLGQTYDIPLHLLQKSDNNARVFYQVEELDEMGRSLAAKGQDIPAVGYVNEQGRVVLTDGQKRFQAATSAGLTSLKVKIDPTPENHAAEYETSRRINLERSSQTAIDDAMRWKDLLDRRVYVSQDELSERLKVDKSIVSRVLGINRIPHRLLRAMSDHEKTRGMSVAYLISGLFDEKKIEDKEKAERMAEEVIDETQKGELSRTQVEALIAKKLRGPQSRQSPESTPVRFGPTKGIIKVFPERGQLDMSFRDLPTEKVTELKQIIEKALQAS